MNDQDTEDESSKADHDVKEVVIKKPHKFIYPRLNFFGGSSVADSCAIGGAANAATQQQLKLSSAGGESKIDSSNASKSPYTFFTMDSEDDDFDLYGSDVANSDVETKRDLLGGHNGLENQNVDFADNGSCLSASSSTVSMPVCRICQLPGVEPANPLISPCRCLGSIRYVHNNCLLVSTYILQESRPHFRI